MAYEYLIEDIIRYNINKDNDLSPIDPNDSLGNGVESNLIEKILSEKTNTIRDTIRLICAIINEREDIKGKVIDGLDSLILHAKNLVLMAEPMIPGYTRCTHVQADIEREIFKLEKAKLDEEVASWRDVLGLKKQLIGLRKELKSAENKKNLFKI